MLILQMCEMNKQLFYKRVYLFKWLLLEFIADLFSSFTRIWKLTPTIAVIYHDDVYE